MEPGFSGLTISYMSMSWDGDVEGFLNDQSCSLAYFLKKHNGKCEVGVAGST